MFCVSFSEAVLHMYWNLLYSHVLFGIFGEGGGGEFHLLLYKELYLRFSEVS